MAYYQRFYRTRSEPREAWLWNGQPETEWPFWLDDALCSMLRAGTLEKGHWWFLRQSPYRAAVRTHPDFLRDFEPIIADANS